MMQTTTMRMMKGKMTCHTLIAGTFDDYSLKLPSRHHLNVRAVIVCVIVGNTIAVATATVTVTGKACA